MKKYLLILLFLLSSHSASAAVTGPIQDVGTTTASTASFVQNITTPAVGDALVMGFANQTSAVNYVTSVTGGGVTWYRVGGTSGSRTSEIWCGVGSTGVGSAITVKTAVAAINNVYFSEWAGMATTGPCNVEWVGRITYASSVLFKTSSTTILNSGDLLYVVARGNGTFSSSFWDNGFTVELPVQAVGVRSGYRLPGATGIMSTEASTSAATGDIVMAVFPPAPVAPTILTPKFVLKGALMKIMGGLFKLKN